MLVSDVMHKRVLTIDPAVSVEVAAKKMKEWNAAFAVIVEKDQIRGIVTAEDLSSPAADMLAENVAHENGNRCIYFSDVQAALTMK